MLGFEQSQNGDVNASDRSSLNPNFSGSLYFHNPNQWYNPAAFILPVAGTYGNVPRDSPVGPGLAEVDLSLLKDIPISERFRLQSRAEGFNLMNRANFGIPNYLTTNTNGTPRSTAGQVTTTATTSRQLQFGLKLLW